MLDTWAFRTFTVRPRENRFDADDFAAELARHGLHGTVAIERHFGAASPFDRLYHQTTEMMIPCGRTGEDGVRKGTRR